MTRTPWVLVGRHLRAHWARTGLTMLAVVVALFLFCFLVSVVTTLDAAVSDAASNRTVTQSAVSLFVELPRDYEPKVKEVPGVEMTTTLQWFGGYWKDPANFFAQFAIDHEVFLDMFAREMLIVEGPDGVTGPAAKAATAAAMRADRRATVIGEGLRRDYGWQVGDTVPITGTIYGMNDGSAWEFNVVGVYKALRGNFDDRSMFFRFDMLAEAVDSGVASGPTGVNIIEANLAPGADIATVSAEIDALFANGPQVTMTSSEAFLQSTFVSMMGNLPLFLGTIGGAVVFAVFFSTVNTLLMASRQRTHEVGILKGLGFSNGVLARLMLTESIVIALIGGALGVAIALLSAGPLRATPLGQFLPTYAVEPSTALLGMGLALAIGIVSGLGPAVIVARLAPVDALRSEG